MFAAALLEVSKRGEAVVELGPRPMIGAVGGEVPEARRKRVWQQASKIGRKERRRRSDSGLADRAGTARRSSPAQQNGKGIKRVAAGVQAIGFKHTCVQQQCIALSKEFGNMGNGVAVVLDRGSETGEGNLLSLQNGEGKGEQEPCARKQAGRKAGKTEEGEICQKQEDEAGQQDDRGAKGDRVDTEEIGGENAKEGKQGEPKDLAKWTADDGREKADQEEGYETERKKLILPAEQVGAEGLGLPEQIFRQGHA